MTLGQVLGPAGGRAGRRADRLPLGRSSSGPSCCGAARRSCRGACPPGRPRDAATTGAARTTSLRELVTVALVVLAGSTQVFFLTSILPQILPPLGVPVESTLEVGGFLIFVTGVAAALGSMAAPRLADLMGDRRAVLWFLLGSSVLPGRCWRRRATCGASGCSASSRCSASRRSSRSRWPPSRSAPPGRPSDSSTRRASGPPSSGRCWRRPCSRGCAPAAGVPGAGRARPGGGAAGGAHGSAVAPARGPKEEGSA